MALPGVLAGGLLSIGQTLIERWFPDPKAKAEAQLDLLKMEQNGELQIMGARIQAIVAEASSEDRWTSRARPTFMYTFYLVILGLVLVAPLVGVFFPAQMELFFTNVGRGFQAIPEELWWTFTAGYLGYAGFRTYEKRQR